MKTIKRILLFISSLWLTACGGGQKGGKDDIQAPQGPPFPYNLESPIEVAKLDNDLEEISGIAYSPEGQLACVQDEEGKLYWVAAASGDIQRVEKFAKDGDYEDLAFVGNDIFVLRSDGRLYHVPPPYTDAEKIDTELSTKNDTEGLCYLKESHQLLIACKAKAGLDEKLSGKRAIYAFDIAKKQLSSQPYLLIDLDRLSALAGREVPFEPSGIAQHPMSNNFYIISSVGKLLIVLNQEGEIIHLQSLDRKGFKQPEGICFAPNGMLYISNEGKGGKANIMSYAYQP